MSDSLQSIINIQISKQTQGVTQAGFGVPLILTDETPIIAWGGELVREYESLTEVLDDWTTSDETYLAAVAAFAQSPRIETLKIGLITAHVAQVSTITFDAPLIVGNTIGEFDIAIAGIEYNITATPFDTDNATTLANLTAKITALAGVGAVDNGTDTITITAAVAGVSFFPETPVVTGGVSQAVATVAVVTPSVGPAESLANISEEDDDWYGVIYTVRTQELVYGVAAYIETQRKIFGTTTDDVNVYNSLITTDIGSVLSLANFERTFVCWNSNTSSYMEAAWMGRLFPLAPGSATWKFKTLAGIVADNLTSSQFSAIKDKNVNIYVRTAGVDMSKEGVSASGEYIDIVRGTDWLQARMEERIFARLVNVDKIPFTDGGITIIEGDIRAQLDQGIIVELLSPDPLDPDSNDKIRSSQPYIVTVPRAIDVPFNDKAERNLTGLRFEAKFAGAIHKVNIVGVITL